jgi:hypothetical protein
MKSRVVPLKTTAGWLLDLGSKAKDGRLFSPFWAAAPRSKDSNRQGNFVCKLEKLSNRWVGVFRVVNGDVEVSSHLMHFVDEDAEPPAGSFPHPMVHESLLIKLDEPSRRVGTGAPPGKPTDPQPLRGGKQPTRGGARGSDTRGTGGTRGRSGAGGSGGGNRGGGSRVRGFSSPSWGDGPELIGAFRCRRCVDENAKCCKAINVSPKESNQYGKTTGKCGVCARGHYSCSFAGKRKSFADDDDDDDDDDDVDDNVPLAQRQRLAPYVGDLEH